MSGSATGPLQVAIFARLNGDSELVGTIGCAVYDEPPDDSPGTFYCTIGEFTEVAGDTFGITGRDMTATVHVWSLGHEGAKDVENALNRIDALLDRWLPTVSGWASTHLLQEYLEIYREPTDPDRTTRHGIVRYRTHLTQSS